MKNRPGKINASMQMNMLAFTEKRVWPWRGSGQVWWRWVDLKSQRSFMTFSYEIYRSVGWCFGAKKGDGHARTKQKTTPGPWTTKAGWSFLCIYLQIDHKFAYCSFKESFKRRDSVVDITSLLDAEERHKCQIFILNTGWIRSNHILQTAPKCVPYATHKTEPERKKGECTEGRGPTWECERNLRGMRKCCWAGTNHSCWGERG